MLKNFKNSLINSFYIAGIIICALAFISLNLNLKTSHFRIGDLSPLKEANKNYEVFGFAPYWNLNKLSNVDFNILTTFAYFGIPVNEDGSLNKDDQGFISFNSPQATRLFEKAHQSKTRVVLTLTIMDNQTIENFLSDDEAKKRAIDESVDLVEKRGIDGINVDMEYLGDPGEEYRQKFSSFVEDLTKRMHSANSFSKVTVSVYASAAKYPKLYDVASISKNSDGIFMMAYDFATTDAEYAMPTAPLKGYKEGKYWYDVASAVGDFLAKMPAEKLILGVPYYGYNYPVEKPGFKASTLSAYYADAEAQTYSSVTKDISPKSEGVSEIKTGWDPVGDVSWKAYFDSESGTWRMIFSEDKKSLSLKYDFAKDKKLGGVGIWALGFDEGTNDLWQLLHQEFGTKIAESKVDIKNGI